jgi:hypothetical protein
VAEQRVWAYAVRPGTGEPGSEAATVGGQIVESARLRAALDVAANRARPADWTDVVFRVDSIDDGGGRRRTSRTRDEVMRLAFGDAAEQDAACQYLAARLSAAMDGRSQPHLLVLVGNVDDNGADGTATFWTFPRDDALRFNVTARPTVEILENVFSQTSRLRKAARFAGQQHEGSFIEGQVLDFQTGRNSIDVANYWVERFLDCTLAVTSIQGTENLATAIRKVNESLDAPEDRERLNIAVLALRNSPRPSWTVDEIADTFLPHDLAAKLRDASADTMTNARFDINHDSYDRLLRTRVFSLESGVVVSSPIGQVGTPDEPAAVVVAGSQLTCQGTIVKERLSGRNGGRAA